MEVELASVAGDAGSRKKTESSSNTLDAGGESRPQKAVAGATPPTAPSPVESRCICSRVPFCWVGKKLASGTCRCVQGTSCNACAVCGWIGVVCVTALALLFLVGYFPCLSLPVYALADESTLKQFVPIHEDPSQPLQAQNRSSHGIVSILSYNIYQRPGPITDWDTAEFNDYKAERLDDLAATFDEFDILLLQESWVVLSQGRKNKLVSVAKEKGFPFYVRGRCTGKPVTSMLNIFSRHPLVDAAEHSFVNSCCDEAMASKGVVAATVWINGNESHKVNLYTTHLMAGFDSTVGPGLRAAQTQELVTFAQQRVASEELAAGGRRSPIVVSGDFNINGRQPGTGYPSAVYETLASNLAGLGAWDIIARDLPSPKVLPITDVTSVLTVQAHIARHI